MKTTFRKSIHIVIALLFLALFVNRFTDYTGNIIKYSLVDFINRSNTSFTFYILAGLELAIAFSLLFLSRSRAGIAIGELCLVLYVPLAMMYQYYSIQNYEYCIGCYYKLHFFNEPYGTTMAIFAGIIISYTLTTLKSRSKPGYGTAATTSHPASASGPETPYHAPGVPHPLYTPSSGTETPEVAAVVQQRAE